MNGEAKMIAPNRHLKIGELLVTQGLLTVEQVQQILMEQELTARPFGDLAERLFGIDPRAVEAAWIEQYLSYDTITDLSQQTVEDPALRALTRRQAWQFRILPLRYEHGHLLAATTRRSLRRSVNFAWATLRDPVCFLIAQDEQVDRYLDEHYPWSVSPNLAAGVR